MKFSRLLFVVMVFCSGALPLLAAVKICRAGGVDIYADNTGGSPVSAAFQTCIDDTSVTALNLEPGTYLVDAPIVVWRAFTIRTNGLAGDNRNCQQLPNGWCATLLASPSPTACINNPAYCIPGNTSSGGLLQALGTRRAIFDHLIIDGNRANRQNTQAKTNCQNGTNVYGFNMRFQNCDGTSSADRCELTYSFIRNALCGTGVEWSGNYGRIQGNAAFNNGVPTTNLWADGITVLRNNNGIVNDNHTYNNTDVAMIFGEARNTQIQSNWIEQNGVYAFAALMLGNFSETGAAQHPSGDYTNALIRYNTIDCYGFWCGFGLNLGPDPWSPLGINYPNIYGGTVTQNDINGARVLINFGGAGTSTTAITVTNNTLTGAPTIAMPLRPGSGCYTSPNVLQNLPNNNTNGSCGNWAVADPIATSYNCLKQCW
jgi:hypothetical protein